jgi:hypothetical protein
MVRNIPTETAASVAKIQPDECGSMRRNMSWVSRLWRVPEGEKVGDRPHPVSIVIAILGPFIAAAGVYLTYVRSREPDPKQVAYLSIEKSTFVLRHTLNRSWANLPNGERDWNVPEHVFLDVDLAMTNVGETPATVQKATYRVAGVKENWTTSTGKNIGRGQVEFSVPLNVTVLPGATETDSPQIMFTVVETAEERKRRSQNLERQERENSFAKSVDVVTVEAIVEYMTAFGTPGPPVTRCWQVATDGGAGPCRSKPMSVL